MLLRRSYIKKIPTFHYFFLNYTFVIFKAYLSCTINYVISFFFIGCVPCVKEIPALHEWIASNAPGVELLFISPIKEDSKKDIERYAERLQVPAKYFYSDPFGNVLRKFFPDKAQGVFPTLLGVREGQVQFVRHTLDDITYEELATLSK